MVTKKEKKIEFLNSLKDAVSECIKITRDSASEDIANGFTPGFDHDWYKEAEKFKGRIEQACDEYQISERVIEKLAEEARDRQFVSGIVLDRLQEKYPQLFGSEGKTLE